MHIAITFLALQCAQQSRVERTSYVPTAPVNRELGRCQVPQVEVGPVVVAKRVEERT